MKFINLHKRSLSDRIDRVTVVELMTLLHPWYISQKSIELNTDNVRHRFKRVVFWLFVDKCIFYIELRRKKSTE